MVINDIILGPLEMRAHRQQILPRAGRKAPIVSGVEREAQDGPGQVSPCTCQNRLLPSLLGKGDERKPEGRLERWGAWVTRRLNASPSHL